MKRRRHLCVTLMASLSFALMISSVPPHSAKSFTSQVVQHGAVGDDAIELQARLQYIGYYKGKIDGVFGWSTYWALRNFQQTYGLKVDGLAGWGTKLKLASVSQYNESYVKRNIQQGRNFTYYGGIPLSQQSGAVQTGSNTKSTVNNKQVPDHLPEGYSANDIKLLANAVYGESRGESYTGQVAVAAVILNRIDSSLFPDTVSGVIFQPGAFTAVTDGQIWLTPNKTAEQAVLDAMNGWDPSYGALYYFNPATATSSWIWDRPQIVRIGKHIFCK